MNGRRGGRLVVAALMAVGSVTVAWTGLALAQPKGGASVPKCLSDPKAAVYLLATGYNRGGKLVGNTMCNDGATAKSTTGGKSYSFTGGVCFRQGDEMTVQIGTDVLFKRVKSDPSGIKISDVPAGPLFKDVASFGYTKAGKIVEWDGGVKLKVSGGAKPQGKFSGVEQRLVGGKLTKVPASGSFTCKRLLKVPG